MGSEPPPNEADVALPVCLPGLQGLPIQITGWSGFTERDSIVVPNDIHCQFGVGLENLYSNTFFMNGTQYFVSKIDISKPKQEGLLDSSIKPFGELHIWGKPTATTLEQTSIALLTIPMSYSSDGNEAGRKFENYNSGLSNFLPTGKDIQIVKYTTCVETQSSTLTVYVAYWTIGIVLTSEFHNRTHFEKNLQKFAIPKSLLNGDQVLTSFQQYNNEYRTKTNRVYTMSKDGNYSIPYSTSVLLSVVSPEFQKGFRLIKGFVVETKSTNLDTSSYKCIAINRLRDIKDGQLTVDPRTGKSLAEENQDMEANTNTFLYPTKDMSSSSAYMTMLIILGIILGLCGLALIIYFIQFLIAPRDVVGLPPVTPSVQAAANLAAAGTLGTATAAASTAVASTASTAVASTATSNLTNAMNSARTIIKD